LRFANNPLALKGGGMSRKARRDDRRAEASRRQGLDQTLQLVLRISHGIAPDRMAFHSYDHDLVTRRAVRPGLGGL
jgi:hypothetical protein